MKNTLSYHRILTFITFILFAIFLQSCTKKNLPEELLGNWETEKIKITVRTKSEKGNYSFTSDSASIKIFIKNDFTASGNIGDANFENAIIKKNPGNPEKRGISYKIKCGSIGKIYKTDPLANKEVEIWLGPINNKLDSELRYTQGFSHFPMAGMIFSRK